MRLTATEERLCKAVEAGLSYTSGGDVRANVLRRLILSLPFSGRRYQLTPAGISIQGATIRGRIELDRVAIAGGGSADSIELHACTLDGGFSGSHSHFSRLSFKNCTFVTRGNPLDPDKKRPMPTIDLSGAKLDSQLDMEGLRPVSEEGLLWIGAMGIRAGGGIDLSSCTLRAPDLIDPRDPDQMESALDLSLAEIKGDLTLRNGSKMTGRFKVRNARIDGDVWMRGAKIEGRGVGDKRGSSIFMQGSRIGGLLMMDCRDNPGGRSDQFSFVCTGDVNLAAVEVGRSLCLYGAVERGNLVSHNLTVEHDLSIGAEIEGAIDLRDAKVGGTLDISQLRAGRTESGDYCETELSLKDATIGRSLRLMRQITGAAEEGQADSAAAGRDVQRFRMNGSVDLEGLTCDMLDDGAGTLWGDRVLVRMNHFVYRQTGWLPEGRPDDRRYKRKPSHKIVGDWILAKRAQGDSPWKWLRDIPRLRDDDFWEPWQHRRNWIYLQFDASKKAPICIARHEVEEEEYHPQPFEQAIRVARSEGREDFAIHFEMLKQRIEWQHFNRLVRWWLAFAAIGLASLWLLVNHGRGPGFWVDGWTYSWTLIALAATVMFMLYASSLRDLIAWLMGREPCKAGKWPGRLTWAIFCLPALMLLLLWWPRPFHFIVAFFIFLVLRSLGVTAHFAMRRGFGYLRRPVRAIITLILAFVIGWWGVHLANRRNMFVVAVAPVAPIAGPDWNARYPTGYDATGTPLLFGSPRRRPGLVVREVSCAATISEPLYALDVLIPIVDLGEESRCEVRRVVDHHSNRSIVHPKSLGLWEMVRSFPDLPLNDHRFWWWMKALYAIAGWFIVSLAILTFARANRTHAELPTEKH